MQRALVCIIMLLMMALPSCTPRLDGYGCYGYTYKTKLQRGTRDGWNSNYVSPYRQCVDKTPPHPDTHRENTRRGG